MTSTTRGKVSNNRKSPKSLSKIINQSENVKSMVQECAKDLYTVNTYLKQELAVESALLGLESAIEKNATVESKVQDAVEELSIVNEALKTEVREREVLEEELIMVNTQKETAQHAALHDTLTGLPNRELFNDRLNHGLEQAKRHGWTLAIMFLDLDKFKNINDTHGHDIGDQVLLTISQRLKENTRSVDTVCRLGGDEFLYLLMEVNNQQAVITIAEKLIATIQQPCIMGQLELVISPSIGISMFPKHGETTDELTKSADEAMYLAKKNKSGYEFAT